MYVEKRLGLLQIGVGAVQDLSVAAVHTYSYLVGSQCELKRFLAHVTTLTVGDATVVAKRRPGGLGVVLGEEVIATLVIPGGSTVGQVVWKDVEPVELEVGDELVFEVTVGATSGAAAYDIELSDDPEVPANNPDMVESA